jgi:NodT family efflux transporter outer membrane factor (OMF) lipoprotein
VTWSAPLEQGLNPEPSDGELLARWWATLGDPMLTDLMERAVANNLDLRAAEARVREARGRRVSARGGLFPTLEVGASGNESHESKQAFSGGGSNRSRSLYQAGFDATWEIDVFGGLRRELEAATADVEASEEDLRDVLVTLTSEVALAYVDVRSFQARVEIAEANLATLSDTYDIARWRAEAGLTTSLDVEQARSAFEETRSQIPLLRTNLSQAKNRLAVLLAEPPGSLTILDERKPIPVVDQGVAVGVPAAMLLRRPDVRRAERELAGDTARIGVAKAAGYPRVTLSGSIGLEALEASNLFSAGADAASIALNLAQTVLDFGRIKGNVEAQEAIREESLAIFKSAVLAALEEVENAMVAFVQEQERRSALGEAAGAAERAAALSRDQYRSGLVDFDTVLVAQRSLITLQDQLTASEGNVTSNLIRLYKALGGGWTPGGDA